MSHRQPAVDDSPYYRSHGKSPRGRGGWAFADINDQRSPQFFHGTFAQARKQARQQMNAPSGVIVVLP